MHLRLCRQIKTNGLICRSPAMGESAYCYFHNRHLQRQAGLRRSGGCAVAQQLELCALKDGESVQRALSAVVNALAADRLETRRATALLYGLQLVCGNSGNARIRGLAESNPRRHTLEKASQPEIAQQDAPGANRTSEQSLEKATGPIDATVDPSPEHPCAD